MSRRRPGSILGATPTPGSSSGVWSLSQAAQAISEGNWKGYSDIQANSIKFDSARLSMLTRTPTSAGNRRTWTWSSWVKRSKLGANQGIFTARNAAANDFFYVAFSSSDTITINDADSSTDITQINTTAVFRDPSAWYHIVVAMDTTQASSIDRVKLWVNGQRFTSFNQNTFPPVNFNGLVNSASVLHRIGHFEDTDRYLDGYVTEAYLVDGQALEADSFGEFDHNTGVWTPKKYTGEFGTNGFYLPMKNYDSVEAFNTVLYTGNGSTQSITGVGFQPDLVWIKERSGSDWHGLFDVARGTGKFLGTNVTNAESGDNSTGLFQSFDSDGFTVNTSWLGGTNTTTNGSGQTTVAWCWKAGDSAVTNTDGSIASTVRTNNTYGFSIISYTSPNDTNDQTVGHGLDAAPDFIIVKNRDSGTNWDIYHSSLGYNASLIFTTGTTRSGAFGAEPTSSVFTTKNDYTHIGTDNFIAYCWTEKAGYSSFGSYTGNGSTVGPVITTGFKPAVVLIKTTTDVESWVIMDNTRDTREDYISNNLLPNSALAENAVDADRVAVKFTDTGFQLVNGESDSITNRDGSNYIYAAFADTREAAYWRDLSGNANNWQPVNYLTDVQNDTASSNFATLNPLAERSGTLSDGNLSTSFGAAYGYSTGTIQVPSTGKWIFEVTFNTTPTTNNYNSCGVITPSFNRSGAFSSSGYGINDASSTFGQSFVENGSRQGSITLPAGTVIQCLIDRDAGTLTFTKDGVLQTGTGSTVDIPSGELFTSVGEYGISATANFGQLGFTYTPPSGYLALSTANLPRPAIGSDSDEKAGNYFNTVLYSGNSTTGHAITGVGFQPDLVWTKGRSDADPNYVHDVIRTVSNRLNTAETTGDGGGLLSSFDSDGFTISSTGNGINGTGHTYVAWCWRAGDSAVTNTDGTITSTVSANTTSGFSIVSYTGTGSAATVGHGLGIAPDMIIGKNRDNTPDWIVYHSSTGRLGGMFLNRTDGFVDNLNYFNDTSPTSSVFTVGSNDRVNTNTEDYIAYCFAEVEGYSKFGSYTGNGSTDGPFVYTGFKPRFIMIKASSSTSQWVLIDTARDTFNSSAARSIFANSTSAEETGNTSEAFDIVSNGFKLRSSGRVNVNGVTHIYMAFAEAPQKFSRSR
jgi:hypothetical protein